VAAVRLQHNFPAAELTRTEGGLGPSYKIWYILPPFVRRELRSCHGESKEMGEKGDLVN